MKRLPFLLWIVLTSFFLIVTAGCGTGLIDPTIDPTSPEEQAVVNELTTSPACDAMTVGYPVMDRHAYERIYNHRGFYTDGNHLGLDLNYPEGTPVYPIVPGIVRIYRAAQGYGTLVVVIEHCAGMPVTVSNGFGQETRVQRFLTIYGHLRKTSQYAGGNTLNWRAGDRVTPYDVIGYIQRDSANGDGAEHVHVGVRLQTMNDAIRQDPTAWFRGYDTAPSQKRWFADASIFYDELSSQLALENFETVYTETPFPRPAPSSRVDAGIDVRMNIDAGTSRDTGPLDAGSVNDRGSSTTVDVHYISTIVDAPLFSAPDVPPVSVAPDVPLMSLPLDVPVARPRESCNGLDDDGNGQIDEIFQCRFGVQLQYCPTSCGSIGYIQCEAPYCSPGTTCRLFAENCTNGSDDDCDGNRDCADSDCSTQSSCLVRDAGSLMSLPDIPPVSVDTGVMPITDVGVASVDSGTSSVIRYEFRVRDGAGWGATEPYRLHDRWWSSVRCDNTGSTTMELRADGWRRCDLSAQLSPFVGSFYSSVHPDWGDRGNLGTVGNAPDRCTPTEGVEWRITNLRTGASLFDGPSADLPCIGEGSQDRHRLP